MLRRRRSGRPLAAFFFASTTLVSLAILLVVSSLLQKDVPTWTLPANSDIRRNRTDNLREIAMCGNVIEGNSKGWLEGKRIGNTYNAVESKSHKEAAQRVLELPMTLTKVESLDNYYLKQIISHELSQFSDTGRHSTDAKGLRMWQVRLAYLSVYYHQHKHAIAEAKSRSTSECRHVFERYGIGPYDFECPDAKFLVVGLGKLGMGANMRAAAVKALLAGLATDRVVLFLNVDNEVLQRKTGDMGPWPHASCSRRDHQCFFMPMSPCVVNQDDLEKAYVLDKKEMRAMIKSGSHPDGRKQDRVLMMHLKIAPQLKLPNGVIAKLQEYSRVFLPPVSPIDNRRNFMELAISSLDSPDERREIGYNYAQANTRIHHSLMFYAMRPHFGSISRISKVMRDIAEPDRRAERVIGLPIRASDKCNQESECLSFQQHIQALEAISEANRLTDSSMVVFTTESSDMMREKSSYESSASPGAHKYQFITNLHDVLPNTGYIEELQHNETSFSADDAMLSAITSLKMQLSADYTMANCCSNFHTLIGDYLIEGLGASSNNRFTCLQEHPLPEYAICCGWHRDCKRKRREYLESHNMTVTVKPFK